MFIDTHTHIYTSEFDADRDEVVERARRAGAEVLLLPCIDEASIAPMLDLCHRYPELCYPMMGLHPTELPVDTDATLQRMERLLTANDAPYVAVGEAGIDLYWDDTRCDEQIAALRTQAEWAARLSLPLIIHSRNAHRETIDALLPYAAHLTGIFHCFGGTADEAEELLRLFPGFCLGIGGIVTFRRSTLPAVLAQVVPLSRLVVETDAPYLAPVPHRGRRNEPAFIPHILDTLAATYGRPRDELAADITANTRRLFPRLGASR